LSEIDPADVTAVPKRIPEVFNPDLVDIAPATSDRKKPEREGLPPGYRMRADAHYVDQLTSRRTDRATVETARSDDRPADAAAWTEKLLAQLSEGISTIESAAALLSSDASAIGRRVNIDLIRTQAWRAAWLLRATAILQGAHRPQIRPRPLAFLLGQIRTGFAAECRLTGVTLAVQTSDWNAVVAADEVSFLTGVTAAIFSTLALIDSAEGVTITVYAVQHDGHLRTIDVVQEEILVPASFSASFFDAPGGDRSATWSSKLAASTIKTAAQQHGGDASFHTTDRGGSLIRLQLSRAS
jgi:hypothetical protein